MSFWKHIAKTQRPGKNAILLACLRKRPRRRLCTDLSPLATTGGLHLQSPGGLPPPLMELARRLLKIRPLSKPLLSASWGPRWASWWKCCSKTVSKGSRKGIQKVIQKRTLQKTWKTLVRYIIYYVSATLSGPKNITF